MLRIINLSCLLLAVAWFARNPDWEPAIVALSLLGALQLQERLFGLRFIDRAEIDRRLGSVEERLQRATSSVQISGNDCKFLVEAESAAVDALLARGVKLRLLLVDPNSNVPEMIARIDPRFATPQQFRDSMVEVLTRVGDWKSKYPGRFECRLLPFLPALGFFIVDSNTFHGIVKIEIYTAKDWKPVASRPHLILDRWNQKWRDYFLVQWDNYWAAGHEP